MNASGKIVSAARASGVPWLGGTLWIALCLVSPYAAMRYDYTAGRLGPPGAYSTSGAVQTGAAHLKLADMEHRAFDLIRQGCLAEAYAILFSAEYGVQKETYAQGMKRFLHTLKVTSDQGGVITFRVAERDGMAALALFERAKSRLDQELALTETPS